MAERSAEWYASKHVKLSAAVFRISGLKALKTLKTLEAREVERCGWKLRRRLSAAAGDRGGGRRAPLQTGQELACVPGPHPRPARAPLLLTLERRGAHDVDRVPFPEPAHPLRPQHLRRTARAGAWGGSQVPGAHRVLVLSSCSAAPTDSSTRPPAPPRPPPRPPLLRCALLGWTSRRQGGACWSGG